MIEENKQHDSCKQASIDAASKIGKAVANIAKGAATGGAHGAALEAAKSAKKWFIPLLALLLLPIILVAMLPTVIFGSFLGDGSETKNAIADEAVFAQNLSELNTGISTILSAALQNVLDRIDSDFSQSCCDEMVINNPYGSNVVFNANTFISMYCASKDTDIESISIDNLKFVLQSHLEKLYSFTYQDTTEFVTVESESTKGEAEAPEMEDSQPEPELVAVTVRTYTIHYNGESYFANQVFSLSEEQRLLSNDYAQNLSVLLNDGIYQVLSEYDGSTSGLTFENVVFTDGVTEITYFNQLDERWRNAPYGTDNIGGYGCGPTSMAIVVSSLTDETVDPTAMAQWAYENGHWCSGSGSYHTLIPTAAEHWNLPVSGCTASEPQKIVDALANGKLIVAIMGKGHFTSSGHFMVLRGVTTDGKILVADPASYNRSQKEWDLSIILNEASKYASAGGPFWIIG